MPENLITFALFLLSAAMNLPKSSGERGKTIVPKSVYFCAFYVAAVAFFERRFPRIFLSRALSDRNLKCSAR